MSLLEDVREYLAEEEGASASEVADVLDNVSLVSDEFVDSGRWSEHWTGVIARGGEFVAVDYEVPATEYQEGGDFYSEAYEVKPVVVTVTKYERV